MGIFDNPCDRPDFIDDGSQCVDCEYRGCDIHPSKYEDEEEED